MSHATRKMLRRRRCSLIAKHTRQLRRLTRLFVAPVGELTAAMDRANEAFKGFGRVLPYTILGYPVVEVPEGDLLGDHAEELHVALRREVVDVFRVPKP